MATVNQITLIGRLARDAEIRSIGNDKELAGFSLATDEGYKDRESGAWVPVINWHRVVTFDPYWIGVLRDHGFKGVQAAVCGELTYRSWRKDGEATDRREAEIKVSRGGGLVLGVRTAAGDNNGEADQDVPL